MLLSRLPIERCHGLAEVQLHRFNYTIGAAEGGASPFRCVHVWPFVWSREACGAGVNEAQA